MITWKPIPSTQGKYEASDQGHIRNAVTGYVLKSHAARGEPAVKLALDGKMVFSRIAQLVWETFNGPLPEGKYAFPLDDPLDCRLGNLAVRSTRTGRLSDLDVLDIFERVADGESRAQVARLYGVSASMISAIINRQAYQAAPVPDALLRQAQRTRQNATVRVV